MLIKNLYDTLLCLRNISFIYVSSLNKLAIILDDQNKITIFQRDQGDANEANRY